MANQVKAKIKSLKIHWRYHKLITLQNQQTIPANRPGTSKILISFLIHTLIILSMTTCSGPERKKPVLKLWHADWKSIELNNAIIRFIAEHGYGYTVEMAEYTAKEQKNAIKNKKINIISELWGPNTKFWVKDYFKKKIILNLGEIFESGEVVYIIPKWVADKYSIRKIEDMKNHWQLFKNPGNPSKGIFYNAVIGWTAVEDNIVKFKYYGLYKHYDLNPLGASEALEAAYERAQKNHQPVFGYYWEPTALMGNYKWQILEEPEYNKECWIKINQAKKKKGLPSAGCACRSINTPPLKVVHSDLAKTAPDIVEMLKKMKTGTDPLNRSLAWIKNNQVTGWEDMAFYYLRENEKRWKTWVTPQACKKIQKKLAQNAPDRE